MSITQGEFEYVRSMVRDRAGIVLEDGKEYLVEARLGPIARMHGLSDPSAVIAALIERPAGELRAEIIDALTTNETSFFRDIHPWTTLKDEIVPSLIGQRGRQRRLRILSGAASTGQEAYTVALMLRHHFPEVAGWDITITGTDISREALAKARSATYTQLEVNRGLPAQMLQYFTQTGRNWQLKDEIRRMVEFRELNLVESWPAMDAFDLVLMRNVLIYFDTTTKQGVLRRIRSVMAPDAFLFLGASETTINLDESFAPIRVGKSTVYVLGAHPLLQPDAASVAAI